MSHLLSVGDVEVVLRAVGDDDPLGRAAAIKALAALPLAPDAARAALNRAEFQNAATDALRTARSRLLARLSTRVPPAQPVVVASVVDARRLAGPVDWLLSHAHEDAVHSFRHAPDGEVRKLLAVICMRLCDRLLDPRGREHRDFARAKLAFIGLRQGRAEPFYAARWPVQARWASARPTVRVQASYGRILTQQDPGSLLALSQPQLTAPDPQLRRVAFISLADAAPIIGAPPADLEDTDADELARPSASGGDANRSTDPFVALARLVLTLYVPPAIPAVPARPAPPGVTRERPPRAPRPRPPRRPRFPRSDTLGHQEPTVGSIPESYEYPPSQSIPFEEERAVGAERPPGKRTVFARLDAPEAVVAGEVFGIEVGLGASIQAGVISGPFAVPQASFTLDVQVLAGGFRVLGSDLALRMPVSAEDPYPYALIRLAAVDEPELSVDRAIQAAYSIDGQTIGIASRVVRVIQPADRNRARRQQAGPAASPSSAPQPPGAVESPSGSQPFATPHSLLAARPARAVGFDWPVPTEPSTRPDLEVIIGPGNDVAGNRLSWIIKSAHQGLPLPTEPVSVLSGGMNAQWARGMMRGVEDRHDAPDRAEYLRGIGCEIRDVMPAEFWTAVRAVAARTAPRPPTLLLASFDPYVPWELAVVDRPWDPAQPDVLGAQAVMGRWTYSDQQGAPAPPATLELGSLGVVGAAYPGGYRLAEAEREAAELARQYGGFNLVAQARAVLDLLGGNPAVDAVHFALHGQFDASGTEDGLMMQDRTWLSYRSVRGVRNSPVRLAFLNACQVGQGQQALGEPAGMAAALIAIGAGAVIAPLWKVDDRIARTVAQGFYPAVLAGESPGEYLRQRRGAAAQPLPAAVPRTASISATETTDRRMADSGAETVLAYVYFGHPLLKVTWTGRSNSA